MNGEASAFQSNLTVELAAEGRNGTGTGRPLADTVHIDISCVGNLFAGTIKNLNKLIRLPSGCGEQNMLNFVPNIVLLRYLKTIGQLKPDIRLKAILYTEKGYQRQLTYRRVDGSFSAFGKADKTGSTWLTAFVAKSFQQAAEFIDIDETVIDTAMDWLARQQQADGSFTETGTVSYKSLQGGSGKGVALTAYVLIAFLANKVRSSLFLSPFLLLVLMRHEDRLVLYLWWYI